MWGVGGRAGAPFLPFAPPEGRRPGCRQHGLARVSMGAGACQEHRLVPSGRPASPGSHRVSALHPVPGMTMQPARDTTILSSRLELALGEAAPCP